MEQNYDYLNSWHLAELRFEHNGWDCFLWFSDDNQGWIVEELRKPVGIIPWADFPDVINGTPEEWLAETAGRIIDASR